MWATNELNRTRVAGRLDEIQGVVASALKLHCNGAVGFIGWLDRVVGATAKSVEAPQA